MSKNKRFIGIVALIMLAVMGFAGQAWSSARDNVVAHAESILNYTWYSSKPILLYYNGYNPYENPDGSLNITTPVVATGTIRGIPYTLSSNNTGGGAEKTFSQYKALSAADKSTLSKIYTYGNGKRISMKYGMSCATFVTDCILQGLTGKGLSVYSNIHIHRQSGWKNYITQGTRTDEGYMALQKGDYLYNATSHVMLVVDNNGSSITVIEQTPPDYTRINCTNKRTISAALTYNGKTKYYRSTRVCMQCDACKRSTTGTQKATYSYSSLRSGGYYPMYVNYGDVPITTTDINPGLLRLTPSSYAQVFTLTSGRYYNLYSNANLTTKLSAENTAWTGENDEDYIIGVGKNSNNVTYARIKYPVGNKRYEAYVKLSEVFVTGTLKDNAISAKARHYGLYARRGSGYNSSYGIDVGDSVYLLTRDNGWCQVLYPTSGGLWRIAWLTESNYNKVIGHIAPVITTTSLPNGTVGKSYTATIKATGSTPIYFTVNALTMSNGLSLDAKYPSNGTIQLKGTPKRAQTFNVIVSAQNSAGSTSKTFQLTINSSSANINDIQFPAAIAGQPFSYQCTATGYVASWRTSTGKIPSGMESYSHNTMPSGLSINARTGLISGTIAHTSQGKSSHQAQRYYFNVTASGASEPKSAFLTVYEPPEITTDRVLTAGTIGTEYSQTITATGTQFSMQWSLASGSLPDGLKLNIARSSRNVTITGKPTKAGRYTFTLKLFNLVGNPETTTKKEFVIAVNTPRDPVSRPLTVNSTFKSGTVGKSYYDYLYVSEGTTPLTWTVASGSLPPGLSLSNKTTSKYVYLRGTPTRAGTYKFTIRATDNTGRTGTKQLNINIIAANFVNNVGNNTTIPEISEQHDEHKGGQFFITGLHVLSSDILTQGTGRYSDTVDVRAHQPVTFMLDEWINSNGQKIDVLDIQVLVNDEHADNISVSDDGTFTIPADIVSDGFRVRAVARTHDDEISSQELLITAIEQ